MVSLVNTAPAAIIEPSAIVLTDGSIIAVAPTQTKSSTMSCENTIGFLFQFLYDYSNTSSGHTNNFYGIIRH